MDPLELNKDAKIDNNDLTQQPAQTNSPETGDISMDQTVESVQPEMPETEKIPDENVPESV